MTTGRSPSGMWDISGILTITMLGLSQVHVSWSGVAVQEVACRLIVGSASSSRTMGAMGAAMASFGCRGFDMSSASSRPQLKKK